MSKYIIVGGQKLAGEIRVSGSKNAVLPLMAACLLTDEECVLTNVPQIKDVQSMIEILTDLGAEVKLDQHRLTVRGGNLKTELNSQLVSKLRGSILLVGPLLARYNKAKLSYPGGDLIGKRSVGAHTEAFKDMGAAVSESDNSLTFSADKLTGAKIVLTETSVTATENVMMAASLAEGVTIIKLAAMEPHVQQLGAFLKKMGAKIKGVGTTTITIEGVSKLSGAKTKVIPDSEEAASFITLAAATKSDVKVSRLNPDYMEDYLLKLRQMNVNFETGEDYVHVRPPLDQYKGTKIQCGFYPKLNSDYVPPMAVLAAQAEGETIIYEWLYENRLGHIPELVRMGANAEILDPHRVKIVGPSVLHGENITTFDLRMGMTLVIAALAATGKSEIDNIEHIDRGYENLDKRLKKLGAKIKRTE